MPETTENPPATLSPGAIECIETGIKLLSEGGPAHQQSSRYVAALLNLVKEQGETIAELEAGLRSMTFDESNGPESCEHCAKNQQTAMGLVTPR